MKNVLAAVLFGGTLFAQANTLALVSGTGYGPASSGGAATIYGSYPGVSAAAAPTPALPFVLGGVKVAVGGHPAGLYYVSATQINFQIPWGIPPDLPEEIFVTLPDGSFGSVVFTFGAAAPSIFEVDSETFQGAILDARNVLVSARNPASPGDIVQIFCTGLGPVDQPQADGLPPTSIANLIEPPSVRIAGEPATVLFAGLAPGFVGLYQINAITPPAIQLVDVPGVSLFGIVPVAVGPSTVWMAYLPR